MDHKILGSGLGGNERNSLDELLDTLPAEDAGAIRDWLSPEVGGPQGLLALLAKVQDDVRRPDPEDPDKVQRIGVIGGGTAGYLTALALKVQRPWLDVTLVESKSIPIIGVGEATVSWFIMFLHHFLHLDADELYAKVQPTWKLGIRFDWGPYADGFMGPFDWSGDAVGIRGSIEETGNINAATLGSLLMGADRAAVYDTTDGPRSLMKYLPFAYHLDNALFVRYLTDAAAARGVEHVEAQIADVTLSDADWVDHLTTTDGRRLEFDLYIDCTGFRSTLLEKAVGSKFVSYASTLFTDSAVTGNVSHGGHIMPYTRATTMNSGWCWGIPTRDENHHGYVYSSAFISDDRAAEELAQLHPGISEPKIVRFRSGRHEQMWRGNVCAIGNSYAFVEPLESTGLLMISIEALTLVSNLPASWREPSIREVVNAGIAQHWDAIRWLLGIHYRYNTRLETPFWKECVSAADVSGFTPLLEAYANGAPLTRRNSVLQDLLNRLAPSYFGLFGIEYLLLGQQVPTRLLPLAEPIEDWRRRKQAADLLVAHALPTRQALEAFDRNPELNRQLLHDEDSWAGRTIAARIGFC